MGNGHAPGTEIGLGAAGVKIAVTDFCAGLPRTAGLAVFFFAAFLTAGFLAGFFLPGFVDAGFFLADFVDTGFFCAGLAGAGFFLAADFAARFTDFLAAFRPDALRPDAFRFGVAVRDAFFGAAFLVATFFLLDFFLDALAIRFSIVCDQIILRCFLRRFPHTLRYAG